MLRHNNPLVWIVNDDEYGSEFCLKATEDGLEMMVHPLSMMGYRLEDGDKVDLADLNRETIRTLNKVAADIRQGPADLAPR